MGDGTLDKAGAAIGTNNALADPGEAMGAARPTDKVLTDIGGEAWPADLDTVEMVAEHGG